MIRRLGTVDLPIDRVRELFSDPESWPQWMFGVLTARVIERSDGRQLAELKQALMGWKLRQRVELRVLPEGVAVRKVRGRPKRWEAEWRFSVPPDGRGTTVSMQFQYDLGAAAWLVTARRIARGTDRFFEKTLRGLERFAPPEADAELLLERAEPRPGEPLLQVFETVSGLEVRVGGRTYFIRAREQR
jgi:hypothetical protein